MSNVLMQLRPDQRAFVQSVLDDLTLEGVHTKKELQLQLEAELDWRLFKRAGICGIRCSAHTLRHSFATLMAAAGCDTHSIKRLMRHSVSGDITDHYIHVDRDTLRQKLERYSPLRLINRDMQKSGLTRYKM